MKYSIRILPVVSCYLILFIFSARAQQLSGTQSTAADVPRTISYQALLTDANGNSVSDNDHIIQARLYSDPLGEHCIWQDSYQVHTLHGMVNLILGSGTKPLPDLSALNGSLWLGIQIDGSSELKNYSELTAAPYALNVPNGSITLQKMGTDYVSSVSINGQEISGKGQHVNIVTGDGLTATIDPITNAILLKEEQASLDHSKGEATQGNTSVVGTLTVTSATTLNSAGGQTSIGSNSSSVKGIIGLQQGSLSGHQVLLEPPNSLSADATIIFPSTTGTLTLTSRNISAGTGLSGGGDLSADRTLSLDVTHANTWSGAQSLPASAAQGNNLITAINAASTGAINVSSGGTGAGQFTSGSVVFAGASGVYNQDNSNLFYDASNHRLGIGTTGPSQAVEVKDGILLLSNSGTAKQLQFQGTSSGISTIQGAAQGSTTINYTLPTSQPSTNDVLTATSISGTGPYAVTLAWAAGGGGSGWGLTGNAISSGNFLGTTNANDLSIETNGIERMRILSGGNVGIGTNAAGQLLEVKDGNMLLSNSGTAQQLQFQGTGSGVSTFQAGAQGSTNINYTLPIAPGAANSKLQNDGSGNLSWSSIGVISFARKTTDQDVTSTSLTNDNALVLPVLANATYIFHGFLSVSDPNLAGLSYRFAFTSPSGSTLKFGFIDATTPGGVSSTIVNGSGTQTYQLSTSTNEIFIQVDGIVVTGGTAGNLQLQFRKVSGGTGSDPVRMNTNSYLQMTRVQ